MKDSKLLSFLLIFAMSSLMTSVGQRSQSIQSIFTKMNKDQIKVAKENRITKAEAVALDKAMTIAGNRLLKVIKASPGKSNQYLVDKINQEFAKLDAAYGKILSGAKLSAWKKLSKQNKSAIVKHLNNKYLGAMKGARTKIRSGLRLGVRATLINGFGGGDVGF